MDNTKSNSENQGNDVSGESLILGKYKNQEEAFAALAQAEKQNNDLKEALDREQRLNQLLDSVREEPQPRAEQSFRNEYPDLFDDEEKARKFNEVLQTREQAIWQKVGSLVDQKVQIQKARDNANDQFYKKYPDLKDFSNIVDSHATALGKELGAKSANVPFDKLAAEVASRVKSELGEMKKKLTKSSLYVEGSSSSEPSFSSDDKASKSSSEEDRALKYFEDEGKAKMEKRNAVFGAR